MILNPIADEVNPGRVATLRLGLGKRMSGWTVQRNCGSGMQSIDVAVRFIQNGNADLVLAGGVEVLSLTPLLFSQDAVNWYGTLNRARSLPKKLATLACSPLTTARRGQLSSNIRPFCSHVTIPRHLRDIVVTELGVADLRGKSDRDYVAAMLNIAPARFQPELLQQVKRAGKIETGYEIPLPFLQNTEGALIGSLSMAARACDLTEYPFGTDLDPLEQHLAALERLKSRGGKTYVLWALLRSFVARAMTQSVGDGLRRLGLASPSSVEDRVMRRVLMVELEELARNRPEWRLGAVVPPT